MAKRQTRCPHVHALKDIGRVEFWLQSLLTLYWLTSSLGRINLGNILNTHGTRGWVAPKVGEVEPVA
jgi:ribosomal protein L35AE/L33A